MEFNHYSVMLTEATDALNIKPDGIYVDGTAGGAGHSSRIASMLDTGRLIALDRDLEAVAVARERLSVYGERAEVVHSNFLDMERAIASLGISKVDGVLLDLGVSSYQLDNAERGFSYMNDAPLDMRMDRSSGIGAYDVVNGYGEAELSKIIYTYGEERFASRIAHAICEQRGIGPIRTTSELVEIIRKAIPQGGRDLHHHPAMRTFQAIRIEVNGELSVIEPAIRAAERILNPGGRISVITFHSLEDRCVKETYNELARGCTCPRSFPVCVCGNKPKIKIITRKPILPSSEELSANSRSHSAKLRVAEKL